MAAAEAIAGGTVAGGDSPARASAAVDATTAITMAGPAGGYVSGAGDKPAGATEAFAVETGGRRALDLRAGTGGFPHHLLERGATEVVALDIGQRHERLPRHAGDRVVEGVIIRHAGPEELGRFDLIVADLSFISLRTVAGALAALALLGADLILLVEPRFEVGRDGLGRGVVRAPGLRRAPDERVLACLAAGIGVRATARRPLPGGDGNRGVFPRARRGETPLPPGEIAA